MNLIIQTINSLIQTNECTELLQREASGQYIYEIVKENLKKIKNESKGTLGVDTNLTTMECQSMIGSR